MKFKKELVAALSLSFVLVAAGCGSNKQSNAERNASAATFGQPESTASAPAKKLQIKTSFYPMYEFTRHVAGDLADVQSLIPADVEPHDWEPTAKDLAEITDADVLVYNGAGLEGWIDQVTSSATGGNLKVIEASKDIQIMDGFEQEEEEHEEGHEGESAEEHDGHKEHDHGGLDPHVWLSPALAVKEVRNIEAELAKIDPEHADTYKANADAYVAELEQLDHDFETGLKDSKRKDFITQHAAFGYLAKEYGLTQVPIAGLSPEQEPSAAKMAEIVDFAKAHDVKTIFFETLVSSSVADTISKEIGAETAVLNPIEGLTAEDEAGGLDYIGLMRQNLDALTKALNE